MRPRCFTGPAAAALALLLLAGCGSSKKAAPARPAPATPASVSTAPPPTAPSAHPAATAAPSEDDVATIRRRLLEATSMYRVYNKTWPSSAQQTLEGLPYQVMSPDQLKVFERIVHQPLPDGSLAIYLTWRRAGQPITERYILQDRVD